MSIKILTHSGSFHADEVLASVILKLAGILDEYTSVIRTRDIQEIESANIVYDVGGEYDHEKGIYDHHQRGRSGELWNDETPFSSAGLIWKHYHDRLNLDEYTINSLEKAWIRPVDADDNGFLPDLPNNVRHISSIVSDLNPPWNDKEADQDEYFVKACEIIETLFTSTIKRSIANSESRQYVQEAISKHKDSDILILDVFSPWKSHIHSLEVEFSIENQFKFVLFPQGPNWKVFQIPVEKGSMEGRIDLPEPWGGLRSDELIKVSGIKDAIFVHPGLFCGGAESLEGAKAMAQFAIDNHNGN